VISYRNDEMVEYISNLRLKLMLPLSDERRANLEQKIKIITNEFATRIFNETHPAPVQSIIRKIDSVTSSTAYEMSKIKTISILNAVPNLVSLQNVQR
jgi:hypothetical protein